MQCKYQIIKYSDNMLLQNQPLSLMLFFLSHPSFKSSSSFFHSPSCFLITFFNFLVWEKDVDLR